MIEFRQVGEGIKLPSGAKVAGAVGKALTEIGINIANQAVLNADGRPGPIVRTGRLRASISHDKRPEVVTLGDGGFSVAIGTNVEYAPRLEMGFKGEESVKEHTRKISKAWGRSIPPRDIHVNAFTRNANTPAYPFLRPAVKYAERIRMVQDIVGKWLKELMV